MCCMTTIALVIQNHEWWSGAEEARAPLPDLPYREQPRGVGSGDLRAGTWCGLSHVCGPMFCLFRESLFHLISHQVEKTE